MVLDVGRDLGDIAVLEPEADRAHAGEAVITALADLGRDPLGVATLGGGGCQLDVEGDERWPGRDEHGAGRGVKSAGPEVGPELAGLDPVGQRPRPSTAQLGTGAPVGQTRRRETPGAPSSVAEQVGEDERLGARGAPVGRRRG